MRALYLISVCMTLTFVYIHDSYAGKRERHAQKKITLVEINDLHAHLVPHDERVSTKKSGKPSKRTEIVKRGGLARIATRIEQIRHENANTLVMNVGDTFHGGVEATFTLGNAIVPAMDALNIDVGVPGNWDFAYGPYVTRARYAPQSIAFLNPIKFLLPKVPELNFPNLAANVRIQYPFQILGPTLLPATLLKEIDSIKVGFIGISSDIVPRMHAYLALGLHFLQGQDAYKTLIDTHSRALRAQGAQIVAVLSELGIHKDYRLAQIIEPDVDFIFSAHTHEATFKPLQSRSGALVVESGNDGFIGQMDVTLKAGKIVSTDWQLHPIDERIAEHPTVKDLIDKARAPFFDPDIKMRSSSIFSNLELTQPIDTVIGYTENQLSRTNALENSFNNAYADLLRLITQTEIAIVPGFRFGVAIAEPGYLFEDRQMLADGAITLEDAYRFFPVSFLISIGEISGASLKQLIEQALTHTFSEDVFMQSGGWVDGFAGLEIDVDLARPDGQRVIQLRNKATGQIIDADQVIKATGCSRPLDSANVLCDFQGFTNIAPALHPTTGQQMTSLQSLVFGLSEHRMGKTNRRDIIDENETKFWPKAIFVQPLTGVPAE